MTILKQKLPIPLELDAEVQYAWNERGDKPVAQSAAQSKAPSVEVWAVFVNIGGREVDIFDLFTEEDMTTLVAQIQNLHHSDT